MSMKMFNNDMIVKLFDDNMEDFDRFRQKLERIGFHLMEQNIMYRSPSGQQPIRKEIRYEFIKENKREGAPVYGVVMKLWKLGKGKTLYDFTVNEDGEYRTFRAPYGNWCVGFARMLQFLKRKKIVDKTM